MVEKIPVPGKMFPVKGKRDQRNALRSPLVPSAKRDMPTARTLENVMILAPNPLYKGVATVEKWGASEKPLHAASRTSRKRQSADTKAKKLSKFKKGKGESNQAARAGSK